MDTHWNIGTYGDVFDAPFMNFLKFQRYLEVRKLLKWSPRLAINISVVWTKCESINAQFWLKKKKNGT